MSPAVVLFGILGALLIGAISPGPSFVLVSRVAVTASRAAGLSAAIGMGLGGAIFGGLALLGLSALLNQIQWLYVVLKLLGGTYLLCLGIRIWRGAPKLLVIPVDRRVANVLSIWQCFLLALITQLSNPKTAVVYGSIFAAFLPVSPELWILLVLPPLIFLVETSWYAIVALVFSAKRPQELYLKSKIWVDRATGLVLGVLGYRLVGEAVVSDQVRDGFDRIFAAG